MTPVTLLLAFFAGTSIGLYYGVRLGRRKRRKYRRSYANRGYHMVYTPPTEEEERERRGDEWAQRIIDEMSDRSADA